MKLINKKTGEIVEAESYNSTTGTIGLCFAEGRRCDRTYNSLAELNEEWGDMKDYWYIHTEFGEPYNDRVAGTDAEQFNEEIGNYFGAKEEAEKAVGKLKAWKRLEDKGFRFYDYDVANDSDGYICGQAFFRADKLDRVHVMGYLDTLFGGE